MTKQQNQNPGQQSQNPGQQGGGQKPGQQQQDPQRQGDKSGQQQGGPKHDREPASDRRNGSSCHRPQTLFLLLAGLPVGRPWAARHEPTRAAR